MSSRTLEGFACLPQGSFLSLRHDEPADRSRITDRTIAVHLWQGKILPAKLEVFTIVLDGYPFITHHLPVLNRLQVDSTLDDKGLLGRCQRPRHRMDPPQQPRLSTDGTTEYLRSIASHPRVTIHDRPIWDGKTAMVNACVASATDPAILMEIDSDEIWTAEQLQTIATLFESRPEVDRMQFWCRYFVGLNIVIGPQDGNSYGCRCEEWTRPMSKESPAKVHETRASAILRLRRRNDGAGRDEGLRAGIRPFRLYTRAQLEYKQTVHGYSGAVDGWERLQVNRSWPTKLKQFMPWVDEKSTADLLVR